MNHRDEVINEIQHCGCVDVCGESCRACEAALRRVERETYLKAAEIAAESREYGDPAHSIAKQLRAKGEE